MEDLPSSILSGSFDYSSNSDNASDGDGDRDTDRTALQVKSQINSTLPTDLATKGRPKTGLLIPNQNNQNTDF